ncbi:MAG: hypothetical protein K8R92_04155 [Planctomycetes bacterium]|nr:hypothetical protein [Planctomycetota bacterium]
MPPLRTIWFALVSLSYSILLFGTTLLGFKLTTQNETGWGAAFLPLSLAILTLALSIMSVMIKRNYKVGMIGIHLALVMPVISAVLLAMRAYDLYETGKQGTQVTLSAMMAVTSIYVFVTMILIRPKKISEEQTIDQAENAGTPLRDLNRN